MLYLISLLGGTANTTVLFARRQDKATLKRGDTRGRAVRRKPVATAAWPETRKHYALQPISLWGADFSPGDLLSFRYR